MTKTLRKEIAVKEHECNPPVCVTTVEIVTWVLLHSNVHRYLITTPL
jgi:hypothetical protein